jgi:hypothetical protein
MTLRDNLIGAWELQSFGSTDVASGAVEHPLGPSPRGLIIYTADGNMSAQLAKPDMSGYVAYGGRFEIDEQNATLHHQVTISMMPELLAQPLFRQASIEGDLLTLAATISDGERTTRSTLVWRRASG